MSSFTFNALPQAMIAFIDKQSSNRQRQLDEWLSKQSSSTPILRINHHQALEHSQLKRWLIETVITQPMSLEQQLQCTLNYLRSHNEYRILIIEPYEILPPSTLMALKHLALQQSTLCKPLLQIILCGHKDPCTTIVNKTIQTLSPKTQPNLLNNTIQSKKPPQNTDHQSNQASVNRFNQHSVKLISLGLLGILMYVLWQVQHQPKHTIRSQPLHSYQQLKKTPPLLEKKSANHDIKSKAITTTDTPRKNHFTLQWANSHDIIATQSLQKKLQLKDSQILRVIQDKNVHFILVSGNYPDAHQAQLALKKFPETLKKHQPWVRPIGQR
ncbi:MAG: hypothetical protein CL816_08685 [Coxiellaceae bacterium]|nr:hypothetical protein [Coxiellaceae bacterium]